MARPLKTNQLTKTPNEMIRVESIDDYIYSSLFNDVYLKKDLPIDYDFSQITESDGQFRMFCEDFKKLAEKHQPAHRDAWNHSSTLKEWIRPILDLLGWNKGSPDSLLIENTLFSLYSAEGDEVTVRPSILVAQDVSAREIISKARRGERAQKEIALYADLVVTTSYFNAWSDRKVHGRYDQVRDEIGTRGDVFSSLGPNVQSSKYLSLMNQEWSIATDGATWRLYKKSSSVGNADTFYEFNLQRAADTYRTAGSLAAKEQCTLALKYFYYFFSYEALKGKPLPFVVQVNEKAKRYMPDLKGDLRGRFVSAMTLACNGYWDSCIKNRKSKPNLSALHDAAESLVFNILFIRSCESNRIFPLHQDYLRRSLAYLVRKIGDYSPEKLWADNQGILEQRLTFICGVSLNPEGDEIYKFVIGLHELIQGGTGKNNDFGFEIEGFRETVFSEEGDKFFHEEKICNRDMIRLIFELTYLESANAGTYLEIPYAHFSPKQLGSIYESFLEFELSILKREQGPRYYVKRRAKEKICWEWVEEKKLPKNVDPAIFVSIKPGGLIFSPSDLRKTTGAFYTPDAIVDYVVKKTLGPLVKGKSSREIRQIRVCDPAMGSGHFLLSTLDFISEVYMDSIKGEKPSFMDAKREILADCVFGIDINPRAVKLAKMSLWLATAQPGRKLERIGDHLVPGNSLTTKNPWEKTHGGSGLRFDAIVGNPPYARIQTLNHLGLDYLNQLKSSFETASEGSFDIYALFIERGYELLKDGGKLGYITPNTYQMSEFGKTLRRFLVRTRALESVTDFRQHQVFKDASTYSCVTVLSKRRNNNFELRRLGESEVGAKDLERFEATIGLAPFFNVSIVDYPVDDSKWSFSDTDQSDVLLKLAHGRPILGDYVMKIYQGVATSADKVFVLDLVSEKGSYFSTKSSITGEQFELEKGICRYFLYGKDISRFSNNKMKRVAIFPYVRQEISKKYELIEPKDFKSKYPKAYRYLEQHRKVLEEREGGKYAGKLFYQYSRPQSLNEFDSPKVMMRNFSLRSQVTLDMIGNQYFTTNIYGINFKRSEREYQLFMLALLNSNTTWFFVKATSPGLRGGYHQYKTKYLLPLPITDFDKVSQDHPKLLKKLISNTILILKNPTDTGLQMQNDSIFYELYGLSDSDIAVIEKATKCKDMADDDEDIIAA